MGKAIFVQVSLQLTEESSVQVDFDIGGLDAVLVEGLRIDLVEQSVHELLHRIVEQGHYFLKVFLVLAHILS